MNLFEQLVYEDNHCIMSLAMTGALNKIRKLAKEELLAIKPELQQ